MAWWKWALVFLSGMLLGSLLWAASDLAVLNVRGGMDLRAEDMEGTELYDDTPIRELGDMTPQERNKFFPIWGRAYFGVSNFKLNDQQGRTVIKVKNLRGNFNLDKLRTGVYRGSVRTAEGSTCGSTAHHRARCRSPRPSAPRPLQSSEILVWRFPSETGRWR